MYSFHNNSELDDLYMEMKQNISRIGSSSNNKCYDDYQKMVITSGKW